MPGTERSFEEFLALQRAYQNRTDTFGVDNRTLTVSDAISAIVNYCKRMRGAGKEEKFSDLPFVLGLRATVGDGGAIVQEPTSEQSTPGIPKDNSLSDRDLKYKVVRSIIDMYNTGRSAAVDVVDHLLASTKVKEAFEQLDLSNEYRHWPQIVPTTEMSSLEEGEELPWEILFNEKLKGILRNTAPKEREHWSRQSIINCIVDAMVAHVNDGAMAVPAGRATDKILALLSPAFVSQEIYDTLNAYRAACAYISSDSWDGCSDCIDILRAARSLDYTWDWAGDSNRIAAELKKVRARVGDVDKIDSPLISRDKVIEFLRNIPEFQPVEKEYPEYEEEDSFGNKTGLVIPSRVDNFTRHTRVDEIIKLFQELP